MTILNEFKAGNLNLKNRVVMAPMTRSRADNKETVPTDLVSLYYGQRASAGLIISEGISISSNAIGYINVPGIYTDVQVAAWKNVTERVQQKGGKIFAQLWHVGRMSHPDLLDGKLPFAPSAINPNSQCYTHDGFKDTVVPREMTIEEIKTTVSDFQNAAQHAIEAGFDGIEIHAANGYLFHQFFALCSNQRDDEYGGSIENRARLLFETLDAISRKVPLSKVGVKLSPDFRNVFGIQTDEETIRLFSYIAKKLNDYDLAYLHLGGYFEADDPQPKETVLKTAKFYRQIFKGPYIINGGLDKDTADGAIANDIADMVSFGQLFISNPDLVKRFELSTALEIADRNTYYTQGEKGYTDYPVVTSVAE